MGVAISLVYSTRQRHNMKVFLFLSLCAALAQAATTPSSLTEEQEKLVSQLEDQELAKEVEGIISGLDEEQLEDHVKLYLLGLPNKLGPLGFLGLHSILQDDEDIVDVKIEGFEPTKAAGSASVTPVGDLLTRKLKAQKAAASAPKFEPAAPKPETDIVGEILERRRRAIRMQ